MRKHYLDNIRFLTIFFVVIFHVYFYYNNIGTEAMFAGLKPYEGAVTFAGIYQYFVYPWFMLLLFVVAGISARYALEKRTERQFLKERVDKILAPSTLGVLAFGWLGGYVIYLHTARGNMPESVPAFVRVIIILCCGIGALWFCHVLFVAALFLLLIRKIAGKCSTDDEKICGWIDQKLSHGIPFVIVMAAVYFVFWGGSHILNMLLITFYRNGIYIPAFLAGYYLFSNESVMEKIKNAVLLLGICAAVSGIFYIVRCYGMAYTDKDVLSRWDLNLYAFFMVLLVLGAGPKWLDFSNNFTNYMGKCCFGIYVLHIPVLLVINYLLAGKELPLTVVYGIELVGGFVVSILLYEVIRRIPVLRYWILGIRKQRNNV